MNSQLQNDGAGVAIALRGKCRRQNHCVSMVRFAGLWELLDRFTAGDFHVRVGSRCVVTVVVFFASRCCSAANFVKKFARFASHVQSQLGRGCVLRKSAKAWILLSETIGFCSQKPLDFVVKNCPKIWGNF